MNFGNLYTIKKNKVILERNNIHKEIIAGYYIYMGKLRLGINSMLIFDKTFKIREKIKFNI